MRARALRLLLAGAVFAVPASNTTRAGEADVVEARADCNAERVCRFAVTLRHADEGWEHYADRWELRAPDGTVLGTRVLHHPHVDEQPFTRSLGGVELPNGVSRVRVRARDSRHGYGGAEVEVEVPARAAAGAEETP